MTYLNSKNSYLSFFLNKGEKIIQIILHFDSEVIDSYLVVWLFPKHFVVN